MNDDEPRKNYWQMKAEIAELQKAVNAKTGKLFSGNLLRGDLNAGRTD